MHPAAPRHGQREQHLARPRPVGAGQRDGIEARGGSWTDTEEEAFKEPIRADYERAGSPYYATARLWDDGVIDPLDTRRVLALGLEAAAQAPIPDPNYGIFRM